ncbi:MAG: two-component regulator propeller domain-containing protein [Flavobacteriaceae bacterium]
MKKYILLFLFLSSFSGLSQTNQSWGGYFSYNHIVGLAESDSRIIAATENAFFSKHLATHEIETFNSIDGLKAEKITAIYHSKPFNLTLLGNENGLLIVIKQNNKQIINKVDIINDVPVLPNKKKINHFLEHEGKVFISTDYGISVFNLETLEFGNTFFIGESGQQTQVLQTTIHNNEIYAVTRPYGIRRASLSNPNLINFNAWETFNSAHWVGIASIGNHLVASGADGILYRHLPGGGTSPILNTNQTILEIKSVNEYLTVTTPQTAYALSQQLAVVAQIGQIFEEPVEFTCSGVIFNTLYIGTTAKALYAIDMNNLNSYLNYTPAGPLRNKVYSIKATADNLWCVFGDNSHLYDPYFPNLGRYGISKLTPEGWIQIPYGDVLEATNLSKVVTAPNNENQVYIGSNHSGVLVVENDIPITLLNTTNTGQNGLEGFTGGNSSSVRIHNMAFDKSNNLWVTNAGTVGKLKVMRNNGSWSSYQINETATSYGDLIIDKNGTKWVGTHSKGLVGFNEAYQNRTIVIDDSDDTGIPHNRVKTLAIDNNNRLWIGTTWGIRVLPSVDRFLTEDYLNVNPVIIIDDGLPQELLYRQEVKKIKIDGANQKWLGTTGSGVFLVSPNGQETIYHFTKDNSPLPSNNILDIDINPRTGEVFFATDKGMVSYKGTATSASENLGGVYVYPNPVRPEYSGTVKIAGLTDKANVKITDIEGNLVHEAKSEGGTIEWDTTAFGKYRVASGVYMIFITTQDASETKVKKVMIIR